MTNGTQNIIRLRPHHLLCTRYLQLDLSGRGRRFSEEIERVKELLSSGRDDVIEIIDGPDELCRACPELRSGRCESPRGNEEAVRKFDRLILQGLALTFDDTKKISEIRHIIQHKTPLAFCRSRCPWRRQCMVFSSGKIQDP